MWLHGPEHDTAVAWGSRQWVVRQRIEQGGCAARDMTTPLLVVRSSTGATDCGLASSHGVTFTCSTWGVAPAARLHFGTGWLMMLGMPQSKLMLVVCFLFFSMSSLLIFFYSSSFTASLLLSVVNSPPPAPARQAPFTMILGHSLATLAST